MPFKSTGSSLYIVSTEIRNESFQMMNFMGNFECCIGVCPKYASQYRSVLHV